MKKLTALICGITIVIATLVSGPAMAQMKMKMVEKGTSPDLLLLKLNMRKLWEDHAQWTRNVIFCLVDDLPGSEQAKARLLRNQDEIGNAIKPYYGEDAGNKLTTLLKTHITISIDVVNAAKVENATALDDANKRWFSNADEISMFLSTANPHYALNDIKKMMHDHLTLTTHEAMQRINKNYDADVIAYDNVRNELLEMSDMLTAGIIKHFPEKFKSLAIK